MDICQVCFFCFSMGYEYMEKRSRTSNSAGDLDEERDRLGQIVYLLIGNSLRDVFEIIQKGFVKGY